jgi:putative ABC transport system ATP-binding protein
VLEVQNLSKAFDGTGQKVQALRDVSLEVAGGEFLVVRGPSGSGKSTLLLACGGLLQGDSGRVKVDGQDVYALSSERRAALRARTIGFVFQRFHLVPYLTVRENVLSPSLAIETPGAVERAEDLLRRVGLSERADHRPSQLSTGERQRTALARALLNQPKLVLADEPTGNLDEDNGRMVLECLAEFVRGGGSVLLVTHDAAAARFAQRSLVLEGGQIRT